MPTESRTVPGGSQPVPRVWHTVPRVRRRMPTTRHIPVNAGFPCSIAAPDSTCGKWSHDHSTQQPQPHSHSQPPPPHRRPLPRRRPSQRHQLRATGTPPAGSAGKLRGRRRAGRFRVCRCRRRTRLSLGEAEGPHRAASTGRRHRVGRGEPRPEYPRPACSPSSYWSSRTTSRHRSPRPKPNSPTHPNSPPPQPRSSPPASAAPGPRHLLRRTLPPRRPSTGGPYRHDLDQVGAAGGHEVQGPFEVGEFAGPGVREDQAEGRPVVLLQLRPGIGRHESHPRIRPQLLAGDRLDGLPRARTTGCRFAPPTQQRR